MVSKYMNQVNRYYSFHQNVIWNMVVAQLPINMVKCILWPCTLFDVHWRCGIYYQEHVLWKTKQQSLGQQSGQLYCGKQNTTVCLHAKYMEQLNSLILDMTACTINLYFFFIRPNNFFLVSELSTLQRV